MTLRLTKNELHFLSMMVLNAAEDYKKNVPAQFMRPLYKLSLKLIAADNNLTPDEVRLMLTQADPNNNTGWFSEWAEAFNRATPVSDPTTL